MKKLITTIFLGLALAVMGEILAFYVYSNIDQGGILNGLIGITAFFSIFFGTIIISIYPEEYVKKNVRFKIKSNYLSFLIGSTLFIIFKLPFVLAIMTFYHFTGNYHDNQLKQFGIVKTVFIESEITGKNSRHDLCFHFIIMVRFGMVCWMLGNFRLAIQHKLFTQVKILTKQNGIINILKIKRMRINNTP